MRQRNLFFSWEVPIEVWTGIGQNVTKACQSSSQQTNPRPPAVRTIQNMHVWKYTMAEFGCTQCHVLTPVEYHYHIITVMLMSCTDHMTT